MSQTENKTEASAPNSGQSEKNQQTNPNVSASSPALISPQAVFTEEEEREAIFDVPVKIMAVVGDVKMPVRDLVRLGRGAVVSLNKKLGSAIDIYANGRLIARGEITIVEEDNIAVTMTDIISAPIENV